MVFGEFLIEKRGHQFIEDITSEDVKGYYGCGIWV